MQYRFQVPFCQRDASLVDTGTSALTITLERFSALPSAVVMGITCFLDAGYVSQLGFTASFLFFALYPRTSMLPQASLSCLAAG